MENKVLSANLAAIKNYDTALYNEILRTNSIKSNFELTKTKIDEYNLVYNGTALHSSDGAANEAQKIVHSIENIENKNAIRIIYGLGLGYLADELINSTPANIIIYEPDLEILRTVFEILEFNKNLSKKNVTVCSNKNKLLEWIELLADKETKISVSFLTSYFNLFKNDIYEFAKTIEYVQGQKQANLNTINKIASKAALNTLESIDNILKTPRIDTFKDIYKGKTALIASAGPSLGENIETIKKNRSKFVLFAVGPALKLLSQNNITPDFACIVEIHDTQGQIEGINLENTNLIFEPYSHTYLWQLHTKNKILFFSQQNFLNDWLARTLNINISAHKTIGTVSYCALSSAKIMGFEKIILCGQDLAFKDGKCYAKGSAYEALECIFDKEANKYRITVKDKELYKHKLLGPVNSKLPYADKSVDEYLKKLNRTIYTVLSQDGSMLPTQAGYALFIKHFEQFAKDNPSIKYINSSSGGAQINGYENLALESALKDDTAIETIAIESVVPNYNTDRLKTLKKKLSVLIKEVILFSDEFNALGDELLKELARRKTLNKNTQKLEEKMTKSVDLFADVYFKEEPLYFLFVSSINALNDNLKKLTNEKNINLYTKYVKNQKLWLSYMKKRSNEALECLSDE